MKAKMKKVLRCSYHRDKGPGFDYIDAVAKGTDGNIHHIRVSCDRFEDWDMPEVKNAYYWPEDIDADVYNVVCNNMLFKRHLLKFINQSNLVYTII